RIQEDLWHVLDRLIGPAYNVHGGFGPLCFSLSKAFSIPNPELLAALTAVIGKRHPSWTEDEVKRSLYGRYASARHRHVPTVIRPPPVLAERLQNVYETYIPVTDVKTGEPLLNPRVRAGFGNVMRHVREGCISDPDPRQLAMHVVTGRSEDGLLTFRSVRGTNPVENYHKRYKDVLSSSRTSPRLAHSVLLAFNADWNVRMAGEATT
ncbi:unnamed protein product, partial [Hapterophycus canaliculatus]